MTRHSMQVHSSLLVTATIRFCPAYWLMRITTLRTRTHLPAKNLGRSWVPLFPQLKGIGPGTARRLVTESCRVTFACGAVVFGAGDPCHHYILVLRGSLRVGLIDSLGHEVTLYRLKSKDSCILTTASLLADSPYSAFAVAESGVEAILLPKTAFLEILSASASFREIVLADHGRRLLNLLRSIGDITFESIDHRLAVKLDELAAEDRVFRGTHQGLATELGTAREVVSRRLKLFERNGWVCLRKRPNHTSSPVQACSSWRSDFGLKDLTPHLDRCFL